MELALYTVIFLLSVAMGLSILWPFLERDVESFGDENAPQVFLNYQRLIQERENLLDTMRDLELDFQMGKISEVDKSQLLTQWLPTLKSLDHRIMEFERTDPTYLKIQNEAKGGIPS